jgi:hypothetical protein
VALPLLLPPGAAASAEALEQALLKQTAKPPGCERTKTGRFA